MKGLLASIHNGDKDHKCTIDPTKFSNPIEDIEHKQVEKNQMENSLMNSKFPRSINVGYVNVRQGAAEMYLAKCSHFIVGPTMGPSWGGTRGGLKDLDVLMLPIKFMTYMNIQAHVFKYLKLKGLKGYS